MQIMFYEVNFPYQSQARNPTVVVAFKCALV